MSGYLGTFRACALLYTSMLAIGPAFAGSLAGQVTTTEGEPVSGAMVTVFDTAKLRKTTVYTAPDGSYAVNTAYHGEVTVRSRTPYYADEAVELILPEEGVVSLDFRVSRLVDPQALSDSLTASAHLTKLEWDDPELRAAFVSQCNYCHQVGNSLTRVPREKAAWLDSVQRMESYFAVLTDSEADGIAAILAEGFTPEPVAAVQSYQVSPELHHAKIEEWLVGDGMSFIHDAAVGFDDKLYGADEGHDLIWILDRDTGEVEKLAEPDIDLPRGGVLSGIPFPIGVFTGKHGPHSLAQTSDGRFWITNALSSSIVSFNPESKQFKLYELGHTHLYPHTVRVDENDIVWFTVVLSNEVIRFDPATEEFDVIELPHNGIWRWLTDKLMPTVVKLAAKFPDSNLATHLSPHKWAGLGRSIFNFPYGIDVNPADGSIWYAKLYLNKIGRIDPHTLEVTEFDTPLKGPRRPRFDDDGILWIPAFDDSALMRYDPAANEFSTYKLPLLAADEYEVPYALNVHPDTGDVWITSNMSDRWFRFVPETETFITYPSPTRVTWLRDWEFTSDGQACASQSNLPSYAIEDGVPSFICVDPEGGSRDREAIRKAIGHE
jgi:virginiamycin B lyase